MLFFERMFCRYAPYKMLTPPLRAKDLYAKASEIGLLQRTNCIRVDTGTIRTECELAPTRKKMHMKEEINRGCRAEHTLKKKKKQCVRDILDRAMLTGVADITRVYSNFSVSKKHRVEVALDAIGAVAKVKSVYVMDIHGLTFLFELQIFKKVMDLLTPSSIMAVNMGEDAGALGSAHFSLIASKILDGSSALRRWYVESNPHRRVTLVRFGLVSHPRGSKDNPTVFTRARRRDIELWKGGHRDSTRLSWLLAPKRAFEGARKHNIAFQSKLCNWRTQCAVTSNVNTIARLDMDTPN
jgi:hypothetical protein